MSSCSWELRILGYTLLNSLISLANSSLALANGFFVLGLIALVDNLPRIGSMELCPDAGTRMAGALFRSLLATRLDIRAFCPTWCVSNPVPLSAHRCPALEPKHAAPPRHTPLWAYRVGRNDAVRLTHLVGEALPALSPVSTAFKPGKTPDAALLSTFDTTPEHERPTLSSN